MEHYKKLFKGFFYAFRGIGATIKTERNMRIHLTCIVYMFSILGLTDWFTLNRGDWCALLIACALVLSGELFNTAIENAIDMMTSEYNEFAKKAKDAASGAVLVSAIFAVAVGLAVLFQPQAFRLMYQYFSSHILSFVLFVLSIIPATLFIFFGLPSKNSK
ncbi:MAG: diacylglycerol kinase family protein [Faecalibacterium sp.]|nr:diacylglycerol kinase family protein [Ruminococcus sp.]MCM1391637.1 diacylglycerol kinase family protein [Ruminococcus sp.]MCM1485754.1 diacylglycerol kinase family protein [Faecalibacterium sp.]